MPLPIIVTVDDDPLVLAAVERDLRANYGTAYRVLAAASGAEALEILPAVKTRGELVALFLVDQRMPGMNGTDFLRRALPLYPDAKKVLLTAYADTDAAIASINEIGLDYYLMKPWDPPEQTLYPVLDDLLGEWAANVPVPYNGIRVAGTLWSPESHDVKEFLARNRVPYLWQDVERDAEARSLVEEVGRGRGDSPAEARLPVVFFPDGSTLVRPDLKSLAEKCGMRTSAAQPFYELVIIGAGPAGLAAAVYGASEGIPLAVIERQATGGQAGTSALIENYLGFPRGVSGADLAHRATAQARRFGAEILTAQEARAIRVEGPYRYVTLGDGTELGCHALLLATGITVNRLEARHAEDFTGAGIYYGAVRTEAENYKDQRVVIVGGANSAAQGALMFSRHGTAVTMVVRGESFRMSRYLVDQITTSPSIEVLYNTEIIEACGSKSLEALIVKTHAAADRRTDTPAETHADTRAETRKIETRALFVFIGAVPHSALVNGLVERDAEGFITTGQQFSAGGRRPKSWTLDRDPFFLETSIPGIFAAGDVRQDANRRVGCADGEGGMAISFINQYLRTV